MKKDQTLQVRLSSEDRADIDLLQRKGGIISAAEVLRQGIRPLAQLLGIKLPDRKPAKR